jgi:hypothetical protein
MTQQSIKVSNTHNLTALNNNILTSLLLLHPGKKHGKDGTDGMANSEDKDGMMQLLIGGETGKQWNKGITHCHGNWRMGALGECWQDEAALLFLIAVHTAMIRKK